MVVEQRVVGRGEGREGESGDSRGGREALAVNKHDSVGKVIAGTRTPRPSRPGCGLGLLSLTQQCPGVWITYCGSDVCLAVERQGRVSLCLFRQGLRHRNARRALLPWLLYLFVPPGRHSSLTAVPRQFGNTHTHTDTWPALPVTEYIRISNIHRGGCPAVSVSVLPPAAALGGYQTTVSAHCSS
ncbi:hypothetical protein O3P69_006148 [Scylla paramamosain]|uniref:Uncharacterized protein n=1 Tax=Scylla paramamosain TaxID=85552 RepID=A0AAW0U5C2_SCYPA